MTNINQPAFHWADGSTVSLAAGTSTGNVEVQTGPLARHLRLYNSGTVTVFIKFGATSGVTAAVTDYPLPGGAVEIVSAPAAWMAAITASGSATIYATPGEGL